MGCFSLLSIIKKVSWHSEVFKKIHPEAMPVQNTSSLWEVKVRYGCG
jgi:hypothetical protein